MIQISFINSIRGYFDLETVEDPAGKSKEVPTCPGFRASYDGNHGYQGIHAKFPYGKLNEQKFMLVTDKAASNTSICQTIISSPHMRHKRKRNTFNFHEKWKVFQK